ncbi:MAG TPA: filamentous hemagglutinin N-terminal domain-containing protein, partial [Chthoniobacteraceae bacterium]|nr:filamentous hemagglutinin N-terminal domain-containing protein [Chthoniobacteraceae bacterium]
MKFAPATRIHFVRSIVGASIAFAPLLHAGVVTDGTVGAAGAIGKVGGNFPIPSTLGTKAGGNLFHSFSQFDLSAGESATFSGTNDVGNILARVTGGSASSIDGTIRSTIPNANLFLINPSGVLFGPNAKLEVDGSFAATTADYVKLNGGGRFDAKTPSNDVLTVAPVSAFGFLAPKPAAISAAGSTLAGANGKKLSFVGGDLALNASKLTAPSGRIELWSANSAGEIAAADGAGTLGGFIHMLRTRADASGDPGGSIVIRSGQLLVDRSSIVSENDGALPGGGIDVSVSGAAVLQLNSRVVTAALGAGAAGDVSLRAGGLSLYGN